MGYEIYYTSAPEGLRPGERGFCTVGATAETPRLLWERMEALSGYRHHVDANGRPGRNPTSYAHWILHLGAVNYHVLSRIGDAGLDYSRRTNALAHHIALNENELASAGPAWMLSQPGVMLTDWNGRVGPIVRAAALPRGKREPKACRAWEKLAGDAGWAGVVAEHFVKNPLRPACLLFNDQQEILPLVEEVFGLLPVEVRWQVTFNTYFTSLPVNVTCQWRCCLADTPAAVAAVRHAAGGLIVDLSHPGRLPAVPQSPWVSMARTGEAMEMPAASGKTKPVVLAAKKPAAAVTAAPAGEAVRPANLPDVPQPRLPLPISENQPAPGEAVLRPDTSWIVVSRRSHRRRLIVLYAMACLAIGFGIWMQIWAYRASSERELPRHVTTAVSPPVSEPPPEILPPLPLPVSRPAPSPVPVPHPVEPPASRPATVPVVDIKPPPPPQGIVLPLALPAPVAGNGLRDAVQVLPMVREKFDNLGEVTMLGVLFPGGGNTLPVQQNDFDGAFVTVPGERGEHPGLMICWRSSSNRADLLPILSMALNKAKPRLEVTWRTSVMLRQPKLVLLAYWVMQNSTLVVCDADQSRPQQLEFRPIRLKQTSLYEPSIDAAELPCDLPATATMALEHALPAGWQMQMAWEKTRKRRDVQVMTVSRIGTKEGAESQFVIRFYPESRTVESDLAARVQSIRASQASAERMLAAIEKEIARFQAVVKPDLDALEKRMAGLVELKKQLAGNPAAGGQTPGQVREEMKALQGAITGQREALEKAIAPLQARRREQVEICRACEEALAGYRQLDALDVVLNLPSGLRVANLRLVRDRD